MSYKIDATNTDNLSDKVLAEKETRKRLLTHARLNYCEKEMLILFAKYDNLLRNCTNDKERKDIAAMGVTEMFFLLGGANPGGELYVDGNLVYKEK